MLGMYLQEQCNKKCQMLQPQLLTKCSSRRITITQGRTDRSLTVDLDLWRLPSKDRLEMDGASCITFLANTVGKLAYK